MHAKALRFVAIVLALSPATLFGHHIEPINTEYGSTVSRPLLDIGVHYFRFSDGPFHSSLTTPLFGMEIPLPSSFQLSLRAPFEVTRGDVPNGEGLGDVGFGVKYWFYGKQEESVRPNLGLNFEVETPTGKRSLGFGHETEYSAGFHLNNTVGRATNFVNVNYAIAVPRDKEESEHNEKFVEFRYAGVFQLKRNLFPTLEFLAARNISEGKTLVNLVPELQYLAGKHSVVKLAVPVGLSKASPDAGIQFQITVTW